MLRATLIALIAIPICFSFAAVSLAKPPVDRVPTVSEPTDRFDDARRTRVPFGLAAPNTTVLFASDFDTGASCSSDGWTVVDLTAQIGTFWHVENYSGLPFGPISGAQSLWCGARPQATGPLCSYVALPGYGNEWDQAWCTTSCIPVTGNLDISFALRLDTEAGYDFLSIETNTACSSPNGWMQCIDGGECIADRWAGAVNESIVRSFPTTATSLRVRLRFNADNGFSDQDGEFDGEGAVHIDNLVVEGLALENFEGEAPGSTTSNDWVSCNPPGFGSSYMALFPGGTLVQQDACASNLSCVWAAIAGSPETYACGGFPLQAAVPRGNARGQYLNAEIWSPAIALTGSSSVINLQFAVYRDMSLDALVFYAWHVRSYSDASCKGAWRDRGFVYWGGQKEWRTEIQPVGDLIVPGATHMEVALGILDQCEYWCGVFGLGFCHPHAPLLDNVRVYRVDIVGPTWGAQAMHMFQDTFPLDGTTTGIARADIALSITAAISPAIQRGDSALITCRDPITASIPTNPSGLADDPALGGKQIYVYVHCSDAAKSGAILTDTPSLFPFKDTVVADGRTWTRIRCHIDGIPENSRFKVDLNDELFEGGDIVEFFFGATNTNNETSYCSGSSLNYVQSDRDEAAATASEFSVLPYSPPHPRYGGILYVDGAEGSTAQQYWDAAFDYFGFLPHVDRFDVRAPTSGVSNRPASQVKNVYEQLYIPYRSILWDGAAYTFVLGDGPGGASGDKSDDYGMLNSYLAAFASHACLPQLPCGGGVYLSGDNIAKDTFQSAVASAVTFKTTYIPFTLTTSNHRPAYGISPTVIGSTGLFAGDSFVARGGCPLLNDFDVMTPSGSTAMLMSYGAPAANNGAVLAKTTGRPSVVLSGFSFIYLGDEGDNGPGDRIHHLNDVLHYLLGEPFTGASPVGVTRLEQNYPNPFNPATTIAFSLAHSARVRIEVFTVAGARVRTLVDESRTAGAYSDVRWDGTDALGVSVASGVYFYKLTAGDFSQTRKMVLLK